jgi:hypothetical protein
MPPLQWPRIRLAASSQLVVPPGQVRPLILARVPTTES